MKKPGGSSPAGHSIQAFFVQVGLGRA